jgi:hypothetical protein
MPSNSQLKRETSSAARFYNSDVKRFRPTRFTAFVTFVIAFINRTRNGDGKYIFSLFFISDRLRDRILFLRERARSENII